MPDGYHYQSYKNVAADGPSYLLVVPQQKEQVPFEHLAKLCAESGIPILPKHLKIGLNIGVFRC